MMFLCDLQAVN